jgi:hypothetical protein
MPFSLSIEGLQELLGIFCWCVWFWDLQNGRYNGDLNERFQMSLSSLKYVCYSVEHEPFTVIW